MKPHRVWKPFQVAPGQSIKTITNYQGNNFLLLTFCFQQLRCLILAARGFGVALNEILRARDPVLKFSCRRREHCALHVIIVDKRYWVPRKFNYLIALYHYNSLKVHEVQLKNKMIKNLKNPLQSVFPYGFVRRVETKQNGKTLATPAIAPSPHTKSSVASTSPSQPTGANRDTHRPVIIITS